MRVVLPSNASMKHFPNNSLAKYTVQLPQTLNLSHGLWEFALVDMQFVKSWYNITNTSLKIIKGSVETLITIENGYYKNPAQFIEHMNEKIENVFKNNPSRKITFQFNKITRRCEINLTLSTDLILELNENLERVLGVTTQEVNAQLNEASKIYPTRGDIVNKVSIHGTGPMKVNNIFNLMVYCDIAESSIVGDTEAPLLRVVPVTREHWTSQHTEFLNLQYIPISQKNIRTISIYIYTDYGEVVPFVNGRTVCTLDFRRRDQLLR